VLAPCALVFLWLLVTRGLDVGALSVAWPHGFCDPVSAFTALIVAGRAVSAAMGLGIVVSL